MCSDLEFIINLHNLGGDALNELPQYPFRLVASHDSSNFLYCVKFEYRLNGSKVIENSCPEGYAVNSYKIYLNECIPCNIWKWVESINGAIKTCQFDYCNILLDRTKECVSKCPSNTYLSSSDFDSSVLCIENCPNFVKSDGSGCTDYCDKFYSVLENGNRICQNLCDLLVVTINTFLNVKLCTSECPYYAPYK